MVVHTCNPSTGEVEAGGLRVESQIGLHNKTWCPKKKKRLLRREREIEGSRFKASLGKS
jgi:hypothetical protein